MPIFDEVSKYLIISQTWKLLKIPCSKYEKICDSFNVEGYPTIKLFKDSQEIKDLFVPRICPERKRNFFGIPFKNDKRAFNLY